MFAWNSLYSIDKQSFKTQNKWEFGIGKQVKQTSEIYDLGSLFNITFLIQTHSTLSDGLPISSAFHIHTRHRFRFSH